VPQERRSICQDPNTLMPKLQKQDEKIHLKKFNKLEGFLEQVIINSNESMTTV
jgi:hypothetical protein